MSCLLTSGRIEPCKKAVGGLKAVYFIDYGTLGTIDYVNASTSAEIDTVAGTPTAYKYDLKGTSSFEQTINSSRENGTTFYDQTLNLTFKKLDKETHDEIALIAVARPHVIVEDNNGNLFLSGLEHGSDVNGGTIVTGAGMGDLSGYTLTLLAQELVPANFLLNDLATTGITVSASQINP
jgi:hypothetical protein